MPAQFIGKQVWTRCDSKMVRIFDHKMQQQASHTRLEKGKFSAVLGVGGCRGSVAQSIGNAGGNEISQCAISNCGESRITADSFDLGCDCAKC